MPPHGQSKKKRGPVARKNMVDTHLYLPEDLLEWAKHQEGGFANLVRQLLHEARQRKECCEPASCAS